MDLELTAAEESFRTRLSDWLSTVEVPQGLRDYGSTHGGPSSASARQPGR